MLVVIAVILILLGIVVGVGSGVFADAKARDTKAMLTILELATNQFRDDAPLAKVPNYSKRYATNYPPDELDIFSAADGIPGYANNILPVGAQLESGGSLIVLGPPPPPNHVEQADVKAMSLAIRQYSAEAASILDRVDARFRRIPKVGTTNQAQEVYVRPSPSGSGTIDTPLEYYVDAWGVPIEYFAVRDQAGTGAASKQDNPPTPRLPASQAFVGANHGQPLFVSYGPDGEDQFSTDMIASQGASDMVSDWTGNPPNDLAGAIDNPLNQDNVYSNPEVATHLAEP